MADPAWNDEQPIRIHPDFARQLEYQQLELCVHPCGCLSTRKKVATPSLVRTIVYNILVYIIVAIVTAYLLVQAMEAISFLLNPHIGMILQVSWIALLMMCGLFPPMIWEANGENDAFEPPPLPRNVGWLVN
ncbi:hypothetical protein HBI56_129450 [Parastagonospora nodorum]|nr:hypothetical protein HBH53_175900 [Parastagonospora nodorum]KAH3972039.1 hypothetical protein HBH51_105670 [Parastagonospora nodorum]KAH3996797.1 hypothetical protein HBI10_151370 [Parastagonospora nodorum]KAH4012417.1 hypothetical protein HBI13_186060 [Parastagonospora nodorum]KAH4029425.1 hypothetical protein HBI09_133170 [Parastagonospora nodorum]